jgi:DNA-directed RNA polymerase subunit RPC12/RpoP
MATFILSPFILFYYSGGSGIGAVLALILIVVRIVVWAARAGNTNTPPPRRPVSNTPNYVNTGYGSSSASSVGQNCYCKYCGKKFTDLTSLMAENCYKNPEMNGNQKHVLYPGMEKAEYSCMHCGKKFSNLVALTSDFCPKHETGNNPGKHEPAF